MYRDDDVARAGRANSLIDEIAELERQRVQHATTDQRLEAARRELAALQPPVPDAPTRTPGLIAHLVVFGATAGVAYLGYTLLI
jgi:cytochrome c-type biogenesis protein CcmH/NrfG